ncbi:hypothetical protein KFK09_006506 [Dendrobium nobile]|uniref:Uncharacterized protein n=1 Tax=Dendrobium nobile TaxID=94219 RepID=A0A8T3BSK1_DENNO|nr:hypothetical protein KFK09_006506 [Dendrobium nobile]
MSFELLTFDSIMYIFPTFTPRHKKGKVVKKKKIVLGGEREREVLHFNIFIFPVFFPNIHTTFTLFFQNSYNSAFKIYVLDRSSLDRSSRPNPMGRFSFTEGEGRADMRRKPHEARGGVHMNFKLLLGAKMRGSEGN